MNDTNVTRAGTRSDTDAADWRPFNVWAEQVRVAKQKPEQTDTNSSAAARETWDPFSVWKRQIRGA